METQLSSLINRLEAIDFTGKGEAFVESRFLPQLLECLGYEIHTDYEVIRHGDDGSAFKLQYPPVGKGAVKVKYYHPDYIPTIRKKAFWIIEAKSPKDISYPFEKKYLVQGFQYCIHPEIQAKYLLVTNGRFSSVYDAHGSVFLGKKIYEPILTFKSSELRQCWSDIYELLSVEKLRSRIETDIKSMYDKLCLSSLDQNYPAKLLSRIGASAVENSRKIQNHVALLTMNSYEEKFKTWRAQMEQLTSTEVFALMNLPLRAGGSEAEYFVEKSLGSGVASGDILAQLICNFGEQSIFRKEQTFAAVCILHNRIDDGVVKTAAREFLNRYEEGELPLLNEVECSNLRLTRKFLVISAYPKLRERIQHDLGVAPEMVKFILPPTALDLSYASELMFHGVWFEKIKVLSVAELEKLLEALLKMEQAIEEDFKEARSRLSGSETQLGGFEYYGLNGKHWAFRNIMHNLKID